MARTVIVPRTWRRRLLGLAAAALLLTACGDDGDTGDGAATDAAETDGAGDDGAGDDGADSAETDGAGDAGDGGPIVLTDDVEHRISESGQFEVECDGGGELYVQSDAAVDVTGNCEDVDVTGTGATVSIEIVDDLDITGDENEVTAEHIDEVDIDGNGNTVTTTSVGDIEVDGSDNTVTFAEGSPSIEDEGSGNTIEQG